MTNKKIDPALILIILGSAIMLFFEVFGAGIFGDSRIGVFLLSIVTRYIGSAVCIAIIYKYASRKVLTTRPKALWFLLPCLAVAINNFQFISYFRGDTYIDATATEIALFGVMCLGVGLFEELAFRGCVFMLVLKYRRKTTKDIFLSIIISSAAFGVVHLTNLFAGASPASVFMQIGYSFLVGGMCSAILIKTENIFLSAIVHGLYNFCGTMVATLGGGEIWNIPTVILTVAVAVAVGIFVIVSLIKFDPKKLDELFEYDKKSASEIVDKE